MPSRDPSQRLRDIVENIDLEQFTRDRKTVYAVTRALEIISEASRRLPQDLKDRHPEIDWPAVAAAGNVYRHEYEAVDEQQLWQTARHDLDLLRRLAAAELDTLLSA